MMMMMMMMMMIDDDDDDDDDADDAAAAAAAEEEEEEKDVEEDVQEEVYICCWFDVSAGLASQAHAVGLEHLEQPARPEMHQCRSASCRAAKHKATWFGWGWVALEKGAG